jgi:lipopolysaccharide/colanic/teichoic acid biosynthesis glycosyltransferase
MSIIGPRPEQESFVKEFNQTIPNYALRHMVRPGITGLAQTEQGYVADANGTVTKLRYDLYYIRNLSFMTDFQITLKTIYTILTGFGAR